jgi:hypothetical protein
MSPSGTPFFGLIRHDHISLNQWDSHNKPRSPPPNAFAIKHRIMPLPIVAEAFAKGLSKIPFAYTVLKTLPWLLAIYALKVYFGGRSNRSERVMHSKVVIITVSFELKLLDGRVLITWP